MTQPRTGNTWPSSWPAGTAIPIDYAFVGANDAWTRQDRSGFLGRDLGLARASGGVLEARHWRRDAGARVDPTERSSRENAFRFLYVVRGSITLAVSSGGREKLGTGGVALHGLGGSFAVVDMSDGFEAIEILAPAENGPGIGLAPLRPMSDEAALARAAPPLFLPESAEAFIVGAGPRRFFAYRDLKVAEATGRRIFIHVVQALKPVSGDNRPGGTGWHTHTMSQLFVVLDGWADIAVEGQGTRRMTAGDAMCLRAGMRHDVPEYSSDYKVLELCVPADYATTAADPPAS